MSLHTDSPRGRGRGAHKLGRLLERRFAAGSYLCTPRAVCDRPAADEADDREPIVEGTSYGSRSRLQDVSDIDRPFERRVGFANSGGLVFVDEPAEEITAA